MSNTNQSFEINVQPHAPIHVTDETYPWINAQLAEVPTVAVELGDDISFVYGSLIALNRTIQRISSPVSMPDSNSVQQAMFMGLPSILRGRPQAGISRVANSSLVGSTLFVASRNLLREPSLVFAVESGGRDQLPTVLRAGVSRPGDLNKLLGAMGITQVGGRRRKS